MVKGPINCILNEYYTGEGKKMIQIVRWKAMEKGDRLILHSNRR